MTPESRDYGLLERLADEFAERHRRGERPTVEEYVARHPALADDLRAMLPAMAQLEQAQHVVAGPGLTTGGRAFGDFRVLREIGRGGMGVVYEAEQLSLGRRVALKVLTQKLLTDAKQKRRFEREARAAARLHHTNIVPVFGFGDADGVPYYVMQFIPGMGLDRVVAELAQQGVAGQATATGPHEPSPRDVSAASVAASLLTGQFVPAEHEADDAGRTITVGGATPDDPSSGSAAQSGVSSVTLPGQSGGARATFWQSVAKLGAQVADALDYAHKQGVIHRDIKPSNLLLDLTGTAWVADFGLAKADDQQDLTHTGDILGTLRYMPPEAFVGRADARGDVYALGLTLYELLALRPAFEEKDRHKLIGMVTGGTPPPLREVRPDVPRDLETIVEKAADRDPARRYATAGELAADLRRFASDEPIRARRQTAVEAAWRWARRHPSTAGLAAAIVVLMVGVTVGSVVAAAHFEEKAKAEREAKGREAAERAEAETQRARADGLRVEAEAQRKETERLVARQYVETGMRLAGDGDYSGALLWNVAALRADPEQADTVRTRIAQLLRQTPVPVHSFFHDAAVKSFRTDPTGRTLAVNLAGGSVVLYDLDTGAARGTLGHDGHVRVVEFSRDGTRLVTLADGVGQPLVGPPLPDDIAQRSRVRVWDVATARPLTPTVTSHVAYGFSAPSGLILASDLASGAPGGFAQPPRQFFCLNDTRIAVCTAPDTYALLDAATGKEAGPLFQQPDQSPRLVETSGNGTHALFTSWAKEKDEDGDPVRVFTVIDVARGRPWTVPDTKNTSGYSDLTRVRFSPDGGLVLASYNDRVRVFDAAGNRVWETDGIPAWNGGFGSFRTLPPPASADGRVVAAPGTRGWAVYHPATKQTTELPDPGFTPMEFGPGNHHLLGVVGDRVAVVTAATGRQVTQLPPGSGGRVSFAPDGRHVASVAGTVVRVFDAGTGQRALPWLSHEAPVGQAEFTPDASRLVTVAGGTVRVWPLARPDTSARSLSPHPMNVAAVSITPDGRRVVTRSTRSGVQVWDAATGRPLTDPARMPGAAGAVPAGAGWGASAPAESMSFEPGGTRLLTTEARQQFGPRPFGAPERVTATLDLATGKLTAWPTAPDQAARSTWTPREVVTWSPAGGTLLRVTEYAWGEYGMGGGSVPPTGPQAPRPASRLEVLGPDGVPLAPAVSEADGLGAVWHPDGRHVLSTQWADREYRSALWAVEPGAPLRKVCDFPAVPTTVGPQSFSGVNYFAGGFPFGQRRYPGPAAHFSADGSRVLFRTAIPSDPLRVWDAHTGAALGLLADTGLTPTGGEPQFSRDGKTVFVPARHQQNLGVRVLDADTGRDRVPMLVPAEPLAGFDVTSDDRRVLTRGGQTAQLWDARTGELLTAPLTHDRVLTSAEFSADDHRVVTQTSSNPQGSRGGFGLPPGWGGGGRGGAETDYRIWDAATGHPLLLGLGDSTALGRDANGTRVVRLAGSVVEVHDLLPDPRPADQLRELAETLAARRLSGGGLVLLDARKLAPAWAGTAPARAAWGTAVTGTAWHEGQRFKTQTPTGPAQFLAGFTSVVNSAAFSWHLDRLIAGNPGNVGYLRERVALNMSGQGDWARVVEDVSRIPPGQLTPNDLTSRGRAHAELGQWDEARRDYAAPGLRAGDRYLPEVQAVALLDLRRGDRAGFDQARAVLQKQPDVLAKALGATAIDRRLGTVYTLWPTLLAPVAPPTEFTADPRTPSSTPGIPLTLYGVPIGAATAYRAGDAAQAVTLLEPRLRADEATAAECFFLAMAAKKSGDAGLATRALEKGVSASAAPVSPPVGVGGFPGGGFPGIGFAPAGFGIATEAWRQRVVNEVLRREAEEVVRGPKP